MAEERPRSSRARLFVALALPGEIRERIWGWGTGALADPALRPVGAESLHVTLAFLGSRPEREIEPLAAVVRESVAPAPIVELLDPEPRPARGRARLFALPARSPGTEVLQADLVERLVTAGFYDPEKRPFWPHVTVARVRPEGRGSRRAMGVAEPPRSLSSDLKDPFLAVRTVLYRSVLQPSGAIYLPLAQVELPGGGQQ
jgi:2'-5' RNA ligase